MSGSERGDGGAVGGECGSCRLVATRRRRPAGGACGCAAALLLAANALVVVSPCSELRSLGTREHFEACAALGADEAACWRSYERRGRQSLWSRTLRACAVSPASGACEAGHAHVCAMLDNTALLYIFVGTSAAVVLLALVAKALRERLKHLSTGRQEAARRD